MATPDEILQAASDIAQTGVSESQVADRREKYFTPKEMVEAAELIASKTRSPFVRVGFRGRVS